VITPRVTRLVRVPDYKAMRAAVARLADGTGLAARRIAVLVPTRGAAGELRRALEQAALASGRSAVLLPDLLTRRELYDRLHAALPAAPPLLTAPEREVLLRRAARTAIAAGAEPPFRLRPGLVLQMLDFYDELRRREQTLDDFARHTVGRLADSAETDRGAERLLRQTKFLCAAYAAFEAATADSGAIDEHALRTLLLDPSAPPQTAYRHVIVTLADQAADPRGLYASDFDLLTRLGGVERIDVIATENRLAAGFHERIHHLLPGLEEERFGAASSLPALVVPEAAEPDQPWFVCRDREEELADVVRVLKHRRHSAHEAMKPPPLEQIGIVFQRPLPYLYLARQVFADGGLPYEALDALPLSAEPYAAMVDVIFSFVASEGNRASLIELLACPHLELAGPLGGAEIRAADDALREAKYAGGWDRLARIEIDDRRAARALDAARTAADALRPMIEAPAASEQLERLLAFIRRYETRPAANAPWAPRHLRARGAILALLESLRHAHARHDDEPMTVQELSSTVRRWIDAQTFSPRTGREGVRLLDAASAPYADLDEMRIVGLVESDWPEPARRSIFYPSSILSNLGWPADASRTAAARAAFQDLLFTAGERISVSLFTLEDDAIVAPSPLTEEIAIAGLPVERWPARPGARVFAHEAVQACEGTGPLPTVVTGSAAEWLGVRRARTARTDRRFAGSTGARAPQTYAISYLERYLDCPFKYFAARVLRLPEERDEESGLTAIERGHFIHDVFETFFTRWQQQGGGTITIDTVADALELFESIVEQKLETLGEADRALERTHLLGSPAAAGLAERAFAFEMEQGGQVVERLLEHELEGDFVFAGADRPRTLRIRGKTDRLDLMADGTIRVIDYKLGKAPKAARALQLPIYGLMAAQALEGHRGRSWTVGSAGYVAFKEKEAFVPLGGRPGGLAAALADGQQRLLEAVAAIERGEFPVNPDEPFRCQWCGYAGVCRKDYVGDE